MNYLKKIKMTLPSCGTVVEACRRATRPCRQRCSPTTIPHGGRDLTPWDAAAVGYDGRCIFLKIFGSSIYFLKIIYIYRVALFYTLGRCRIGFYTH
jgi:hypothetical protein